LKFKFDKKVSRNKKETNLNKVSPKIILNRINIKKIIKFIYIIKNPL